MHAVTFLVSNQAANLPAFVESIISSFVFCNVSLTLDNADEEFHSFSLKPSVWRIPLRAVKLAERASLFIAKIFSLVSETNDQHTFYYLSSCLQRVEDSIFETWLPSPSGTK